MANEQNTDNVSQDNSQENVETNNDALASPAPCVYTTEPIIITQPGDNTDLSAITVGPGQTYIFDFDPSVVQSAYQQDGDLIIKFTNNSSVTLQDFEGAFSEQFPPALTLADGTIISATNLISTLTVAENEPAEDLLEEPQAEIRTSEVEETTTEQAQEVAKVEPAAGQDDIAEQLAAIETAAGDEAGASNSGFGFGSSFVAGPIDPLDDVGPIDPTQLQYGVEFVNDILFLEDPQEQPGTPKDDPILVGPQPEFMDETNLGPLVDTGQIIADFGNDGPGTIGPNGSFVEGGSLLGSNLTSDDVPVIVSPTADGYEGLAGGTPVFTLVINPDTGEYTFTLLEPLDHMDANDPNDEITLEFGVVATDNGGQTAQTTITVTVADDAVTAHDDFNAYNVADGAANGNVVSGFNGGPGAADELSNDLENTVVEVSFNGSMITIPDGGSNTINGDFGELEMFSDGTYTYTLFNPVPTGTTMESLDPVEADTAGNANSITKNGITVTSENGADLAWVPSDGSGIGIAGGGSNKVWPAGETLEVDFVASDKVVVTLADIGANNLDDSIDFNIYLASDPNTPISFLFDIGTTAPVDGKITIELDGNDFGGQIVGFDVFATTEPASFLLHDVKITHTGPECIQDQFEYVLQDGDFDTDPALLTLKGRIPKDDPILVQPEEVTVDETDLAPTTFISDMIEADFGNDGPGSFSGNGGFFSAVPLTSDGNIVNVNFDAPSNTYTGISNGSTIFTLVIQSDGNYTFTLEGVLDHPDMTDPNDNIPMEFGMTATDNSGDTANGIITVNVLDDGPVAHDDMNMFTVTDGGSDGNVITGDNGGAGADDDLSKDVINKVTEVAFGGNTMTVPMNGTTTINGNFGALEISSDGSYNYTLFSIPTTPGQTVHKHLDVIPADLDGISSTVTKGGITVSSFLGDDLTWEDFSAQGGGSGIGTKGAGDSHGKVWKGTPGDGLHVDFDMPATSVMFDIGDLHNNMTSGLDYIVYLTDGTSVQGEYDIGTMAVVDGIGSFTLDASSFGAAGITSVDLFSVDNSNLGSASWILNNVWSEHACVEQIHLDLVPAELDGFQNTFTKNGITIESFLGDDLVWDTNNVDGPGIGTKAAGESHARVWGVTDGLHVGFGEPTTTATFEIGDLGSNNLDDGIDWIVYLSDGSSVQGEFDINTVTVVDGLASFTIDSADFGTDLTITKVDLFSIDNSHLGRASFLLNNVWAGHECEDPKETHDVFKYTLTDNDGDDSTAELALWGSTTESVIASAQGDEDLYGTASADTFLYDSLADGFDTIKGFDHTEGDILDIAALLSQYNPLQDSINDFVFGTEAGGNTTIAVDENGGGDVNNATAIALIEGAVGLDLEIITNDGQAVVV
ncbi:MAG: hypothetical protein DHS20C02_14120 [Micavibrio sp.]|nr:MAG: hypothetical protein DHS20C02_14120 [Micavibrio sp.]